MELLLKTSDLKKGIFKKHPKDYVPEDFDISAHAIKKADTIIYTKGKNKYILKENRVSSRVLASNHKIQPTSKKVNIVKNKYELYRKTKYKRMSMNEYETMLNDSCLGPVDGASWYFKGKYFEAYATPMRYGSFLRNIRPRKFKQLFKEFIKNTYDDRD